MAGNKDYALTKKAYMVEETLNRASEIGAHFMDYYFEAWNGMLDLKEKINHWRYVILEEAQNNELEYQRFIKFINDDYLPISERVMNSLKAMITNHMMIREKQSEVKK